MCETAVNVGSCVSVWRLRVFVGRSNAKSRYFFLVLMSNIHPAKVESDTLDTDPASVLTADITSTHTNPAISSVWRPYLDMFDH